MKRGVILQDRKLKIPSEVVYILAVALLLRATLLILLIAIGVVRRDENGLRHLSMGLRRRSTSREGQCQGADARGGGTG